MKTTRRVPGGCSTRTAWLAWAAALAIAACADSPFEPTLTTGGELQVRPRLVRTITDTTVTLRAVAFDSTGAPVFTGPVHWSTLNSGILTVDDSGAVHTLVAGWGRVVVRGADTSLEDTAVVAVGLRLAHISAGYDYGCGWMADGTGYCWGAATGSYWGVLGTGSPPSSITPAPITGGLHFNTIATGERHTCAIASGGVYCWGSRMQSALGFSPCPPSSDANGGCHVPGRVDLAGTWEHVAVTPVDNVAASCASGPAGLACWGESRIAAVPWRGCAYCRPEVISPDLVGPVALGVLHGCALDAAGRASCWGDNRYGQLGASIPPQGCRSPACEASDEFIPVATGERFVDLVAGSQFTCGLTATGEAFCWGNYDRFAESLGPPGATPVAVAGSLRFQKLDAGNGHVCGLTAEGAIYCWGDAGWSGAFGEPLLAYGEVLLEPRRVAAGLTFTDVAAGDLFTCGITVEGATVCVGSHAGLGQGTYSVQSTSPLPIAPPGALPGYVEILE